MRLGSHSIERHSRRPARFVSLPPADPDFVARPDDFAK
jgi:hypothetical protein